MTTNDKFPNRVREIRENRLMTQAQLARKAKVALRTIHSVEKGMNCRMDTKRKILLALGLRFEDKDYVFPSKNRSPMHGLPQDPGSSTPQGGGMSGGGTTGGAMSGGGGMPGSGMPGSGMGGGWSENQ